MGLAISSGLIGVTAGAIITTGKSILSGVTVITDTVNVATATVYDNAQGNASGTAIAKVSATATTGANSIAFVTPIRAEFGLSIVVTGVGSPQAIVYYGS